MGTVYKTNIRKIILGNFYLKLRVKYFLAIACSYHLRNLLCLASEKYYKSLDVNAKAKTSPHVSRTKGALICHHLCYSYLACSILWVGLF
jgi:hypothetical protein